MPLLLHWLCLPGDTLPPDYFRPPSTEENPVNRVVAFYPPAGFAGTFERIAPGQPWAMVATPSDGK